MYNPMPIDDALAQLRKSSNNLESKTDIPKKELVITYKPGELLSLIDNEIKYYNKKEEDIDIERIIDSFNMEEKYKPVIEEYVTEIKELKSKRNEKLDKNADGLGDALFWISNISSGVIGAGVGALIGYFTGNDAGDFAASGTMIGFGVEFFLLPSGIFIVYKLLKTDYETAAKDYKECKDIVRNKTLLKLQNL